MSRDWPVVRGNGVRVIWSKDTGNVLHEPKD
jgi:hypothetical protein